MDRDEEKESKIRSTHVMIDFNIFSSFQEILDSSKQLTFTAYQYFGFVWDGATGPIKFDYTAPSNGEYCFNHERAAMWNGEVKSFGADSTRAYSIRLVVQFDP